MVLNIPKALLYIVILTFYTFHITNQDLPKLLATIFLQKMNLLKRENPSIIT